MSIHAEDPPHPRDSFLLGSSRGFLKDMLGTFVNAWRECGDVVWLRAPRPMYVLVHPDHVRHVLAEHRQGHPRSGYVRKRVSSIMGRALFTVDNAEWRELEPLVAPSFAESQLSGYADTIVGAATEAVARWEDGRQIDVAEEMLTLSLDQMGRLLWSDEWKSQAGALRQALVDICDFAIPRVTGFPTPAERLTARYRRYRAGVSLIHSATDRAAAERRESPRDDLITQFVTARHDGVGLSDDQLRDTVRMALFGVYKGPAIALTWLWYLLSAHPEVRRRLHDELQRELEGRAPAAVDLARLELLRRVVLETLRLYPTLWMTSNPPRTEETIGGFRIPERVYLIVMQYITHRHPEFWENPEAFDPRRFSAERSEARHPYAYVPFGRGYRSCLGERYALLQLALTTAVIAQRFQLDTAPAYPIRRKSEFLLRPVGGIPMMLRARA